MRAEQIRDEDLLRAFARGRKSALAELARRHERPLLGFASGLLAGRSDRVACDVVQETWLRVIRYADSFDGRSGFKTWLYRIAINQCKSAWAARPEPGSSEAVTAQADPAAGRQAQNAELARITNGSRGPGTIVRERHTPSALTSSGLKLFRQRGFQALQFVFEYRE